MSPQRRATIIGMFGPVLQALGLVWDLVEHGVLARDEIAQLTLRHIISGPPHLIIAAGFAVSLVCIPVAIEVALARPEELTMPEAEAEPAATLDARLEAAQ